MFVQVSAQTDTSSVNCLLRRIEKQQIKSDRFFIKGIFPSYIDQAYKGFSTKNKDNNIFFSALILYTLETLKPSLDHSSQQIIDTIIANTSVLFPKFVNQTGRGTYNFWRTDTAFPFPYNRWMEHITHSWQLPDDMDDTVMSLMAQQADDSTAKRMHTLMQGFSAYSPKKVRTVPKKYSTIPAYSTWFGKKFPVFYDVCVASNVLTFVQQYQLAWTKADNANLQLLLTAIASKDYIKKVGAISPYYMHSSVVLYHFARLMQVKEIPLLTPYKPQLIEDALGLYANSHNLLEKLMLSSAIHKWGYDPPALILPANNELYDLIEQNDLPFFVGNMAAYFAKPFNKILMASLKKILLYHHYCPAYNDVLLLEYLALNK